MQSAAWRRRDNRRRIILSLPITIRFVVLNTNVGLQPHSNIIGLILTRIVISCGELFLTNNNDNGNGKSIGIIKHIIVPYHNPVEYNAISGNNFGTSVIPTRRMKAIVPDGGHNNTNRKKNRNPCSDDDHDRSG